MNIKNHELTNSSPMYYDLTLKRWRMLGGSEAAERYEVGEEIAGGSSVHHFF